MDTIKTGEEHKTDQTSTRPNCHCSKKTSSSNCYVESLPVDVIFEILVRVPAQDVHNSTRLVCRKWHNIIRNRDFKHAHLHRSPRGLLAQHLDSKRIPQHMTFIASKAADDDDLSIEISNLNYRSPNIVLSQHDVLSSCNGLLLQTRYYPRRLYVTNPATEQKLDLPSILSNTMLSYGSAIAHVAATMEYKVVRAVINQQVIKSQHNCVAMLTLGVDEDWTCRVNTQHISLQARNLLTLPFPLTTQGFVHWARDEGELSWARYERQYGHVLTLNVETEIITQFPVPSLRPFHENGETEVIYLPMGSYLSLLVKRSKFTWELWEMKPETGEWTQMPSIDLEAQLVSSRKYIFRPVGWLRPREVLVFSARYFAPPIYFAFTVGTRKLQELKLDGGTKRFLVHRNSLVWIN